MFGEKFPYTNFHDLNLDWILRMIRTLDEKFDEAIVSKITVADPIQWDITRQYPYLTVVVDNNEAYLSMQPVPMGIPLTNTDYWQKIFDMATFYQMIDDLEQKLDDSIENMQEELDGAISDMREDLSGSTTALNHRIDVETVKSNATKTLLLVGDSYLTFYDYQLAKAIKANIGVPPERVYTVAVSGSAFSDASNSYLQQIQDYTGDKTAITDILVIGGINDASANIPAYSYIYPDVSFLTGAIDTFAGYVRNNYPNAKLHIAYVGGTHAQSAYYARVHPARSQEWAFWAYTVYASGAGFRVLDGVWNVIHSTLSNYNSDGVHPSSEYGVPAIADAVCKAFNDETVVVNRPVIQVQMLAAGVNAWSNIVGLKKITDNIMTLTVVDGFIQIGQGSTLGSDYQVIFSMGRDSNNMGMDAMVRDTLYVNCTVGLSGFDGFTGPKTAPAVLKLENGQISIKIFSPSGSTWETITAGAFSAVTFASIPPLVIPVWDIN